MKSLHENTQRIVVCAAIRRPSDFTVICGPRHGDCLNKIKSFGKGEPAERWECGFVDQDNVFMTRGEAWIVANEALQIRRPFGFERSYSKQEKPLEEKDVPNSHKLLFSENLY